MCCADEVVGANREWRGGVPVGAVVLVMVVLVLVLVVLMVVLVMVVPARKE
jgi:hypothetical protein